MAGSLQAVPGFDLQPSAEQIATQQNYITNFDFLNQYLPDTYEEEFARYGDRSVSSFLRQMGAEIPSTSDLIKWTEQGRLFVKYVDVESGDAAASDTATLTVNDTLDPGDGGIAYRVGQTVHISANGGTGFNKGIITAVDTGAGTFDVAYYEAGGQTFAAGVPLTVWVYGSEFKKGADGMQGTLDSDVEFFENSPIILKDKFEVNGSDMAQIGWVDIETEGGESGYLWYMKSKGDTRMRFDTTLETAMIEAVPAEVGSGAIAATGDVGNKGTEGIFYVVQNRGNVWSGGNPDTLADFDDIVARLDNQGSIEENVLMLNRQFGFDIDDMLAAQNSYGAGGTSYGIFDNDENMALNLGFTGFRRGYDFYKSDWKYLNEPTMRGNLGSGGVNGLLVPAGSKNVYDQVMSRNVRRPFLHVRYRASQTEDRRYKTWVTGGAGGANSDDFDLMRVNFLSERCVCTMGAVNFMIFED